MRSMTLRGLLPFAKTSSFEAVVPSLWTGGSAASTKARHTESRHFGVPRNPVQALLADAQGVWAWSPLGRHAPAMRHASLGDWMRENPGNDMQLWVSGHLVRGLWPMPCSTRTGVGTFVAKARGELVERQGAREASWPLADGECEREIDACTLVGIELEALLEPVRRCGVHVHSVVPWWYHAFQQAQRCVNALNNAARGQVFVVEGQQIANIETSFGQLVRMRQETLDSAHVVCLGELIRSVATHGRECFSPPVVLGHGLEDGARTQRLDAYVLGRLDGQHPPQWLRPSSHTKSRSID